MGPATAEKIKLAMVKREPAVFPNRVIPYYDLASARLNMTAKKFEPKLALPAGTTDSGLIEDVAQAFKEPITREGGKTVLAKWVKKQVSSKEYSTFFAKIPSYYQLSSMSGLVTIGFRVPTHNVDLSKHDECDETEINRLERLANPIK